MALATGRVFSLTLTGNTVRTSIGPTAGTATDLMLRIRAADPEEVRDTKRALAHGLAEARLSGATVSAAHDDGDDEITGISLPGEDIAAVGPAIRGDFYAITGSGIPTGTVVVFETATTTVTVTPQIIRPHWVFIQELPAAVPTGRVRVHLESGGWSSGTLRVDVSAEPRLRVRTLYSGAPKESPYTFVFVGNPAIEAESGGGVSADPVLGDRAGYHAAVTQSLLNLLTVTEDLLRRGSRDQSLRVVSVFDETRAAATATALVHEIAPNLMETRRDRIRPFLSGYGVTADIALLMHGSTTHDRATAWFTTDDGAKGGVATTYDGTARTHGRFPSIPGSTAIPISFDTTGLTVLHEFGHAASDFNNGMVIDLYVNGTRSGFVVNKKMRASATDAIPTNFATVAGTTYTSDQSRDGIGYDTGWNSYHPALIDTTRPNLMDNYWLAAQPQQCRLDNLTNDWLNARLTAKLSR